MNLAQLNRVTKSFGEVVAISDVSFSVQDGSIMGFLGPNGSGKTTSIRLLLGLIAPQTGQVRLFGKSPLTTSIKKDIGYVPESDSFHRFLTAQEYLIALGRYHMTKSIASTRAQDVLEELDLMEAKNKKITNFSKGMRQRIKVGQALMHKPKLIIADEPFNGLDPIIRKNIFDLFKSYRQQGTTFFVSSHILFEVERLADQVVILYKGRTIAQGHPHRIRELIQEQPHSIKIVSKDSANLVKLLVDYNEGADLIASVQFEETSKNNDLRTIEVLTKKPKDFYTLITDLVVDHNLIIKEMTSDEGLESLFKSLTVG